MSSVAATASTMSAPGAIAWAYSTSSDVSTLQESVSPEPSAPVPAAWRTVSDGGAGIPKAASNWATSSAIVGLP